jgi:NAD-dependent dihydropyrimidine dehydrogenase PreA subunit
MEGFRYIPGVSTLTFDRDKCVGCGQCTIVCPHRVFVQKFDKAELEDRDACMECGACALNCPTGAITVSPGVGCAAAIIGSWLKRKGAGAGCCC